MSSTKIIKTRLKELLKFEKAFGIAINGDWGVGKTFFWQELIKDNFVDEKIAYISLFGQETIQQIKNDLLLQVYTQNGFTKNIKDKIGSFKLYGMDISLALSWFEKKDFENVIICFDDFERMSDKLKLKDVLGLISELKEQKNCHVLMILNKGELKDEDLSKYKDKIIDYDFNYAPTPEESYSLVKESLKVFQDYPLEYFQKHNINNIRVIKRVINALNDYSFVEELVKEHKDIERELVENILEISTINAIDLSVDFEELSRYSNPYDLEELKNQEYGQPSREKAKNEDFEKLLNYINFGNSGYFHMSDFTHNVVSYVKNSLIEEEPLKKGVDKRIASQKYSSVKNEIYDYLAKARYGLNYTFEEYTKNLYKLLEENKENIINILDSDNFIYFIEELKKYDNTNNQQYNTFAIEVLKKYLEVHRKNDDGIYDPFKEKKIEEIISFHSDLKNYYESQNTETINDIDSSEKVINLVKKVIKREWDGSAISLNHLKEEDLEKYFYESIDFVKNSLMFFSWEKKSVSGDFLPYKEKLLKVITKISTEGNEEQKIKMNMLLEKQ
ncbi:hypothetical protein FCU45_07215 [Sulfurimonas crateris]|uniref:KAP NTPase domain-containing protein n=1 Tax=Sulfurimonas crateris TaxID=2574727 RepID=A0A4U2Z748_9BACT|nr:hypothetical protein [Sulfurimonas crateris]TKI69300.1 hypothetical protein FCU45_07215 [Sulfurimonas crateris]